jgi:hypothetical protein
MLSMTRPEPSELDAASDLLSRLAREHGLASLRHGADPGEIIADVDADRGYFAVVAFEDAVEGRLGWRPDVVPSGALGAHPAGQIGAGDTHTA